MKRTIIKIVAVLLVLLTFVGGSPIPAQAVRLAPPPLHTPVLIVPGITGTEIYKGNELLWPDIYRMVNPLNSDSFMDPLGFDQNLNPLDSSLVPGSVIRLIRPVPPSSFFKFDYTDGLIQQLKTEGYQENIDIFTFPYDWRFGVNRNAQLLQGAIAQIIQQTNSAKVDVVAHSNGGLIVKKYVMDTADPKIGKAVFVGTPNLGAPWAVKTLLSGDSLGIPNLSPNEIQKIAHNMPVVYDLSPTAQYVNKQGNYFSISTKKDLIFSSTQGLNYRQTESYLVGQKGLNGLGVAAADQLHTPAYDSFDVRTKGVDAYNIVGCATGTVGGIVEHTGSLLANGYAVSFVPGDGTVPLSSADNIPTANQTWYAQNADHSKMLSQDGSRQEIVKLISGNQAINPGPSISQDSSHCNLNGRVISIFSPVNIEAVDQNGNKTVVLADGSVQNDIPGARLEVLGEHKFLYLPDSGSQGNLQTYTVNLTGTGKGVFTLETATLAGNTQTSTSVYENIPVTANSTGQLDLSGDTSLRFSNKQYRPKVKKYLRHGKHPRKLKKD
jgi:pimeloyl-ACP methyl ester carboxylesterase